MHQTAQHARLRHLFEVRARPAAALTEAIDLADSEAPAYEVVERDAPNDEVAPGVGRCKSHAVCRQILQSLGLDERKVVAAPVRVRERPGAPRSGRPEARSP